MTREEAIIHIGTFRAITKDITKYKGKAIDKAFDMAIKALEQEPCPNAISRSDMLDAVGHGTTYTSEELQGIIKGLPSVNPQPKTGYISIDDVMSVFDDFMRGEVDEDGTDTFLKMLKDRAESEVNK